MPLRARVSPLILPALLLAALACAHSEPFQDPDETNHGPFSPTVPVQLTYSPGPDLTPAFLPGDTLVLYSFALTSGRRTNQCIGALPVGGGTRTSESCPKTVGALDSLERLESPVALNDSVIALVQTLRRLDGGSDGPILLGTAPWQEADQIVGRLEFPLSSSGVVENSASYLAPIGGGSLVYLGLADVYACPTATPDCKPPVQLQVGRQISQVDLQGTGAPVALPGTAYATSAAAGSAPGDVLFTLPFDSRVYLLHAGGSVVTLYDFGAPNVARDPVLVGRRLVAITGSGVQSWTSGGQEYQVDPGGRIALVDLDDGQLTYITDGEVPYKRPALSADGQVIVAEGNGNLFRFDLP